MELSKITTYQHVYFVGIGGIGMSALARFFKSQGKKVSGYDLTQTKLTDILSASGIAIHYETNVDLIPEDIDLVIYTPAIPKDHAELVALQNSTIPVIKRSKALGLLSKSMDCIAVAGTHGKTSTSAILAHLMVSGGLDPTAFVGGILKNYGTNYIEGSSNWFVAEADEYDRSFLQLYPKITIIQSLDPDHLDIYGDHEEMIRTYEKFSLQTQEGGTIILQEGLRSMFSDDWENELIKRKIKFIEISEEGEAKIQNVKVENHRFYFDLTTPDRVFRHLLSVMPGHHNIMNASAAILAVLEAGLAPEKLADCMASFEGIKRRFEWIADTQDFILIDDYAHHPTEIKSAIDTARLLYPDSKITAIFQPHLYSRTNDFYREFAEQLDRLDRVYVLPIYPARELPTPGVSSKMIVDIMKTFNGYCIDFQDISTKLRDYKPEILLTLGASDLDKYHRTIIDILS